MRLRDPDCRATPLVQPKRSIDKSRSKESHFTFRVFLSGRIDPRNQFTDSDCPVVARQDVRDVEGEVLDQTARVANEVGGRPRCARSSVRSGATYQRRRGVAVRCACFVVGSHCFHTVIPPHTLLSGVMILFILLTREEP